MSTEDLMKPRYKAIANYPGSDFKIGDILTKAEECYAFEIEPGLIRQYSAHMIESYPHLFNPLQWWEERKLEELPQYVKVKDEDCEVMQVAKGAILKIERYSGELLDHFRVYESGSGYCGWITPASEFEYNEYLKQSK